MSHYLRVFNGRDLLLSVDIEDAKEPTWSCWKTDICVTLDLPGYTRWILLQDNTEQACKQFEKLTDVATWFWGQHMLVPCNSHNSSMLVIEKQTGRELPLHEVADKVFGYLLEKTLELHLTITHD